MRLAVATVGLIGMLVAVFVAAGYLQASFASAIAAKAAFAAQLERVASTKARLAEQARRVGSIVIAFAGEPCQEMRFDNFTGAFISIAQVDCDLRLEQPSAASDAAEKRVSSMRSVLASFKK
jgi:uncharacterized protein YceH (UPF0502 family)